MTTADAIEITDSARTLLSLDDDDEAELEQLHDYLRHVAHTNPELRVDDKTAQWLLYLQRRKVEEVTEIAAELAAA